MHWEKSVGLLEVHPGGRNGKLLILRLTPRGIRRPRLETTRSSRISLRTVS